MNYTPKVKVITGYRDDQYHTIDADEAHKAYYLFEHPKERGIFSNGVALRGEDIKSIVPDIHATMGWNPTHQLDSDDWNEVRDLKLDYKIKKMLAFAKEVAMVALPEDFNTSLTDLVNGKYAALGPKTYETRGGSMKQIGTMLK